jgi:hypothetical protein
MQATKKHGTKMTDTKKNDIKSQEKDNQKSGSGNFIHPAPPAPEVSSPVRGSRDRSKHVSEVKHESHKDEYRRDHAKGITGMKNPSAGITSKTAPVTTTPAASVMK